jgi:hypothetical protein
MRRASDGKQTRHNYDTYPYHDPKPSLFRLVSILLLLIKYLRIAYDRNC